MILFYDTRRTSVKVPPPPKKKKKKTHTHMFFWSQIEILQLFMNPGETQVSDQYGPGLPFISPWQNFIPSVNYEPIQLIHWYHASACTLKNAFLHEPIWVQSKRCKRKCAWHIWIHMVYHHIYICIIAYKCISYQCISSSFPLQHLKKRMIWDD